MLYTHRTCTRVCVCIMCIRLPVPGRPGHMSRLLALLASTFSPFCLCRSAHLWRKAHNERERERERAYNTRMDGANMSKPSHTCTTLINLEMSETPNSALSAPRHRLLANASEVNANRMNTFVVSTYARISLSPQPQTLKREIVRSSHPTIPCPLYSEATTRVQETAQLHVTPPPEAESKVTPSLLTSHT